MTSSLFSKRFDTKRLPGLSTFRSFTIPLRCALDHPLLDQGRAEFIRQRDHDGEVG